MMGEEEIRPSISASDFNMRLFIDTNVLIDFILEYDEKKSKSFIELFKNSRIENVELVTSDYVLWEFYGHFRDELYVRKLISDNKYGHIGANKECRRRIFKKVNLPDMENFGNAIKGYVQQFAENPVSIQRLIGETLDGFSNFIEKILQSSKFTYQDSIVFVSALYTRSHLIVTLDEPFSSERHLQDLREALSSVPLNIDIEFKKPINFSTENDVKKEYKIWFEKQNKNKQIGKVFHYYPRKKVICVECLKPYTLRTKDYIYLVNFNETTNDKFIKSFQIKTDGMRDFKTKEIIKEGKKVTIKLPEDFSLSGGSLANTMVFISE